MKIVAITGSIGCGKTTLAGIVRKIGYAVYDVDGWVHQLYNNELFLAELVKLFPLSVVKGKADKKYLRKLFFSDKSKLKKLENLIYPILKQRLKKLINKKAKQKGICFLDVALLFEKNWDKYCDYIILADVDYEIQKQRVMQRDCITEDIFNKINNNQLKNSDKKVLSDFVVDTNKSLNLLKTELINIIKRLEYYNG
ncbi:MAG: dephospho-CoA kinase [Alphaproteobacteria bacterium]|nr:dephospho-CoA kinase [Alphaproteobacteria bacterium]